MAPESRHISVVIQQRTAVVYEYAVDPANLVHWAAGLANTKLERVDGQWMADSPMGQVLVQFTEHNSYGVLDHFVTLPSGESVYNHLA